MWKAPLGKLVRSIVCLVVFAFGGEAKADFTLHFEHPDFEIAADYNTVLEFSIDISVMGDLVAGGVYSNPALNSVQYRILGDLRLESTPSGFDSLFLLSRDIAGGEFYDLSDEASLEFSVSVGADLSDGLQFSELNGVQPVFSFNAREFDQDPGRYHPPIFTLSSDGTGQLTNANNMSTFPNPGNGQLVDVSVGAEYIAGLTFNPNITISAVPEPASTILLIGVFGGIAYRRLRRVR